MSEAKPRALVLADDLLGPWPSRPGARLEAAAELRRQHEAIVALSEALQAIERLTTPDDWLELPRIGNLARAALTKHGVKQ
jgi:hypothetical protein